MIKICGYCKEGYETNNESRKFCSKLCYGNSKVRSEVVKCTLCGKEHLRQLRDIKRYKKLYCSIECRSQHALVGKNSPFYKEKIKKKCSICGENIFVRENRIRKNNVCSESCRISLLREQAEKVKKKRAKRSCSFCGKDIIRSNNKFKNKQLFFCNYNCKAEWQKENLTGEKSYTWKGGATGLDDLIRNSSDYSEIRELCFKRDGFKSVLSKIEGNRGFGRLNHHHLTPYSILIKKNNINKENWRDFKDVLFDLSNVVTLLESEHLEFHAKYGKVSSKELFQEYILVKREES